MALSFSNSDIRFSLTFKKATLKVRFTDLLSALYNPTYGWTLVNTKGIINVIGSISGVVYQNTGWFTSSFSSPDIHGDGTPAWYKEFDLPVDVDGEVINQEFEVEYLLTNGVTTYTISKTYDFSYVSPVMTVALTHSCRPALLTSKDNTGTDYLFGTIVPSVTRTHLITEPAGTTRTPAGAETTYNTLTDTRIIGGTLVPETSLWSGEWQNYITSVLSYNAEIWGGYTWIVIEDTVYGYIPHNVQCTDCACILNQCIANFFDYTLDKRNTDPASYQILREKSIEVLMRWMQFESAERCGEDYDEYCTDIQNIVKGTKCFCLQDLSTAPQPIYPVTGSTIISGGGSSFNFILTNVQPSGIGWDWAIQWDGLTIPSASTFYYLWQNVGGTPFFVGDLKGPAGIDGKDGTNGTGANQAILWNDIGNKGTPSGTSETDLKAYTIPSGLLGNNGEQIEIDAIVTFAANDRGKTVRLYWGGNEIYKYFTDSLIQTGDDKLRLNAIINRVADDEQYVIGKSERGNKIYSPKETEWAVDLTSPVIVKLTGQNSDSYANDIVAKQFCVKYIGLVAGIPSFLVTYKFGTETLLAGVQKDVVFTTPFASVPYTLNLTAWDVNGDTQQVTIIGTPSITGFSVSTIVNTTLSWSAFL